MSHAGAWCYVPGSGCRVRRESRTQHPDPGT
jgi:hypothetical protein